MSKRTVTICVITEHGNVYNEEGQKFLIDMVCPPFDKDDEFIFLMGAVFKDPRIVAQEMKNADEFVIAYPTRGKKTINTSIATDKEGYIDFLLNPPAVIEEYTTFELMQYIHDTSSNNDDE